MKLKFDPYQFEKTISQGIPVYWKNIPWANGFVYIHVIWCIGARHDPIGKEGLAHFLEHMPFDGCAGYPTFDDIEAIDRQLFLRSLNATTSLEYTVYHCKVNSEKLQQAMEFLRRLILDPTIDSDEVERERKVIVQEMWQRYGNERGEALDKHRQKLIYGNHPFARIKNAGGWHDTIASITQDDIRTFHSTHYLSGNLKLLFVGDIDESSLHRAADTFTHRAPHGRSVAPVAQIAHWPNPEVNELRISASEYFGLTGASIPQSAEIKVSRGMPTPENMQTLFIIPPLLREIFLTRIRGKIGATYSPKVSESIAIDHCMVRISLEVKPDTLGDVRDIIASTIAEIASGDLQHHDIFNEIKSVFLEKKVLLDVSADEIADEAHGELAVTGGITSIEEDCRSASKIEYSDIVHLFLREFAPEQLFWSILTP